MDAQPIVKTSTRSPALIKAQRKYYQKQKAMGITRTPSMKKAQDKYRKSVMHTEKFKNHYAKYSMNFYNLNKEKISKQRKATRDKKKLNAVISQIKNISNNISKDE